MTCRHRPGDPNCSATQATIRQAIQDNAPDPDKFQVLDAARVGQHLVLKVQYDTCAKCSFDGAKVLVLLDVTETQALKFKRIDPHFRDHKPEDNQAPSSAARFPATQEGWQDAIKYAYSKSNPR